MEAKHITPILNVSNLQESFAWFAKLGWCRAFDWGDPPDFGGVGSGECEIFLCQDGQGGRGEHGVWMSVFVDNVDAVHERCRDAGVEITWGPKDMPWHVREMHIRHPDGHILRISQAL